SETLLRHFRNLAPAPIATQVDALLQDERGRWVDAKVRSFLTKENFHVFVHDKEVENEFKNKAEGRNADLGKVMKVIRGDILNYTATRIADLTWARNLTAGIVAMLLALALLLMLRAGTTISRQMIEITEGVAEGAGQVLAASRQIAAASAELARSASSQ